MYCKHCGKQMDDNAIYCSQCGTKNVFDNIAEEQPKNNKPENNLHHNIDNYDKEKSSGCGCFIAFVVIVLIVIAVILVAVVGEGVSDGKSPAEAVNQITSRDATNGDINIDDKLDIGSLSLDIIILPNSNIDDLEITIKYLDKNQNILKKDVKSVGNVKAGVQVTKNISLTEFSYSEILKIEYYEIRVTGGTVSYFQK